MVTQGASGAPDALSIASCSYESGISLQGNIPAGTSQFSVDGADGLDTDTRRLILLGDNEPAHVMWKVGSTVTVDTDIGAVNYQGTSKAYPLGTKLCTVKVVSFAIDTLNARLQMSDSTLANLEPFADGITDLQIDTLSAGRQYRVTLTATSDRLMPGKGTVETRQRSTVVTLRSGA